MSLSLTRRTLLAASAAALALTTLSAHAQELKELRIGYQKAGVLLAAKQQGLIEKRLEGKGISVRWVEFQFGPPLLEALNTGNIDYGYTGDSPPIFAQVARANLLYVAAIPARGYGQAIIVPPDSSIKTLSDLKGKKVGVAKASSAHNLLISALEHAGLKFTDITPVYLPPADAAAAYARGSIDAWSIWDPYFAITELTAKSARELPIDRAATAQNSFFLANRDFTAKHSDIVKLVNEEVDRATRWADKNREGAAALFTQANGVEINAQKKAVARAEYSFGPLTEKVQNDQQAVADRFFRLGLIPKPINIRDIVWKPGSNS